MDQPKEFWTNCHGTQFGGRAGIYVGEWKDGKWNGNGILYYSSGAKYAGGFKDGKKHGTGVYTRFRGSVEAVKWENGNLLHTRKITPPRSYRD